MKYFLILIILGLCGGGYYEYTALQQQITDLGAKVDALQAENKQLEDDKASLAKNVKDAQVKIVYLSSQTPSALAQAALQAQQGGQPTTATGAQSASPNNLGTIATLDGKTYQNCRLINVEATDIVVNDSDGIAQIPYALMPPDLQKRFGYDPQKAGALTEAQIRYQEQLRKAAEDAGVPEQAIAP